jgi:propanol-preferring alcohol dehydrogenase
MQPLSGNLVAMRAALLECFGEPLTVRDVPEPVPGPGQILIRVEACGLCHSDLHVARGEWEGLQPRMPMPVILGHEVAGRVVRLGAGSARFREGDRVGVPWFFWTCGECPYCRRDQEVFCDRSEITGVTVHGGFAESLVAWETHALPIPAGLSLIEAAPLFCAGSTVWSALGKVDLDASVRLGVWGAGGLGLYAVQIGKLRGAEVTAVDLHESRLALARRFGADATVAARDAGAWFSRADCRVDVALVAATSADAYESAFRSLRKNGVLLVVGIPSRPLSWTAGDLIRSGTRIVPSRVASRREIEELLRLAATGKIRSEVVRFPLDRINDAIKELLEGRVAGRAVVELADTD